MTITSCYKKGVTEATARPNLMAVLWLFNILFASILYFIFFGAFETAVGPSLALKDLLKTGDMNIILETLTKPANPFASAFRAAPIVILLYFLANVFLQGGILSILIAPRGRQKFAACFFGGGGQFYGRFLRLLIYSAVVWVPVGVLFVAVNAVLRVLGDPSRERQMVLFVIIRFALGLFLLHLVKMVLDYARIMIATRDSRTVFRALKDAVRFVVRRFRGTLGLYYLLGLTGLAISLAYLGVKSIIGATTAAGILAVFLITQVYIAGRGWLRAAYQAGQLEMFISESPPQETNQETNKGEAGAKEETAAL
jgi:hypothetical protein